MEPRSGTGSPDIPTAATFGASRECFSKHDEGATVVLERDGLVTLYELVRGNTGL